MTIFLLAFLSLDPVPVPHGPSAVHAVDFNKDNKPDLLILCRNGVATYLRAGNTWKPEAYVEIPGAPTSMAAADFDHDGNIDVAVADHDTFGLLILRGDGKGGLSKRNTVRAKSTGQPHVHGLLSADLNHDGAADLVFISSGEGELIPLINDREGSFVSRPALKVAGTAWHPAIGDVNGDGHFDVVSADFNGNTASVALGDGKGGFTLASKPQTFGRPFYPKLDDIDGDGKLDIYSVHDDHGRVTLLKGDGKGGFTPVAGSPLDIGREAYGVVAFDWNGDGRLDIVCAAGSELRVFDQTKPMVFAGPAKRAEGVGGYHLTRADFDGDGKMEVAIANADKNQIVFYRSGQ
jgi:hypothetical protein